MTDSPPVSPKAPRKPRPYRLDGEVPEAYLAVGRIVGVHGLKGEVKVELWTDFPERFEPGAIITVGSEMAELVVREARPHKAHVLIAFEEVGDRNEAEALRGSWLYVPEDEAADLDENAYWVHDILGMTVFSDEGARLGVVTDVLFTGANEVYVVRSPSDSQEILLPATDEVIVAVNVAGRRMTVHLIPGILDQEQAAQEHG